MMNMGLKWILDRASPDGERGRLSVLIFHRVLEQRDELLPDEPTASEFEERLCWLRNCFNVIPLEDGIAGLRNGRLPRRAAAISFDDGYANNYTVALPILERLGLHATFFIAAGYLDGGRMFNDTVIELVRRCSSPTLDLSSLGLGVIDIGTAESKRQAIGMLLNRVKYLESSKRDRAVAELAMQAAARLPSDLMMSSGQVAGLTKAGMGVGGHTVSHPILASLPDDEAIAEIRSGRERLEAICGMRVSLFAYPNGQPDRDYSARTVRLVRELGFQGAVTTSRGAGASGGDPFQVPRFSPWSRGALRSTGQMLRNLLGPTRFATENSFRPEILGHDTSA